MPHILGYSDRDGPPRLLVTEGTRLDALPLVGQFNWRLSAMRICIGNTEAGIHTPCPTQEPVSQHPQCTDCSGMEDAACIFEPKCQADPSSCTCATTFKDVTHVVYLAFHGTLPKVGMTQQRRVDKRLREQGADAWFTLATVPDRGTARTTEQHVSMLYRIPEHRNHRETLPQLMRPVPWDTIELRAAELRDRLEGAYDVERTLHRIADHPLAQPLPSAPRRVPSEGPHAGTWIGAKGNHLVYEERPRPDRLALALTRPLACLKRSDLIGRKVTVAAT